jgi:hypothetical protein
MVAVCLAAPLGAGERLTIRVSPAVAFAPANLIVRTMVEANKDNRSIEVIAESDEFYRSSELSMDGDRAPRTNLIQFRSLPGGAYQVRAVLKGAGGHELAHSEVNINVVDSADSSLIG